MVARGHKAREGRQNLSWVSMCSKVDVVACELPEGQPQLSCASATVISPWAAPAPPLRASLGHLCGPQQVWQTGFICLEGVPGTLEGEGLRPRPAGPSDRKSREEQCAAVRWGGAALRALTLS